MEKKSKLESRRLLKKRKPTFLRQDGHKKVKLGQKWRKPKGIQNKMRLHKRGYRRSVSKGFKSPREIRGTSRTGLQIVPVFNMNDIANIDNKVQGALVSSGVGRKIRVDICKFAIEKNITILNIKDPAKFVKETEQEIQKKKEQKKKVSAEKEKKQKEKEAKAEKKEKEAKKEDKAEESIEDKLEDTKKEEKKEKDKILTKKE